MVRTNTRSVHRIVFEKDDTLTLSHYKYIFATGCKMQDKCFGYEIM